MAVRFRRKSRGPTLPPLSFKRRFWTTVAKAMAADQVDRVERQETPGGGRIKRNAQSTLDRKRKQGKPQLSLVDERQSYIQDRFGSYEPVYLPRDSGVKIRIRSAKMRKVAEYLIAKGYDWIGISQALDGAIRALFRADIRRQLRERR